MFLSESSKRRPSSEDNKMNHDVARTVAKKAKATGSGAISLSPEASPRVLTFKCDNDRLAKLQLLSNHTLQDLVLEVCQHTPVGFDGAEYIEHQWWTISFKGVKYPSMRIEGSTKPCAHEMKLGELGLTDGCTFTLHYDCRGIHWYTITFLGSGEMANGETEEDFPRNVAPTEMPTTYVEFEPVTQNGESFDLDEMFPRLSDWIFIETKHSYGKNVRVDLFQAGRKQHFGYMDKNAVMMYLPVKPDNLTDWLDYFDQGAEHSQGSICCTWTSTVLIPKSKLTRELAEKYEYSPFIDDNYTERFDDILTDAFPKIAALAGLRKDKSVPKGWITMKRRLDKVDLFICSGKTHKLPSNAPKGTAFDGWKQYEPAHEPLFEISDVEINGLQDLFCVVEGLLRTL